MHLGGRLPYHSDEIVRDLHPLPFYPFLRRKPPRKKAPAVVFSFTGYSIAQCGGKCKGGAKIVSSCRRCNVTARFFRFAQIPPIFSSTRENLHEAFTNGQNCIDRTNGGGRIKTSTGKVSRHTKDEKQKGSQMMRKQTYFKRSFPSPLPPLWLCLCAPPRWPTMIQRRR